jgi:predicted transcriptional regulator
MRRNKLQIISDILLVCEPGACKTKIVYSANLNFKTINPYLNLLSLKGYIMEIKELGPSCTYKTTEKGLERLQDLKVIHEELIEPLSLAD